LEHFKFVVIPLKNLRNCWSRCTIIIILKGLIKKSNTFYFNKRTNSVYIFFNQPIRPKHNLASLKLQKVHGLLPSYSAYPSWPSRAHTYDHKSITILLKYVMWIVGYYKRNLKLLDGFLYPNIIEIICVVLYNQ